MKDQKPLFVDLDGTLIKEDLSNLAFITYLKKNPFKTIMYIFIFFFLGKAYLKKKISINFEVSFDRIKFNKSCINYILQEKNKGRLIFLISGSHQILVDQIQRRLKLFKRVYGTHGNYNMVGINKIKFIKNNLNYTYFDYIGNSEKDLPIWDFTRNIIFTNASSNLRKIINTKKINKFEIEAIFD